ncbi:MAG TPA: LLM class flavin-dependent oxidoreductase, partial [Stellaceae bacterium]|nr:LLM class flavin-dependent oxidoreductase [Stellaceae bacterium]
MEFGMFHQFPVVPGGSETDAFERAFEQVDVAERYGLDAMWLAELHVDPARSVLAAPMTIASAIAARTERIKIGIAVQVLPLCHPLRIAEEAATVDQVSRGRLIFGVGRSGLPRTYEAYGIPYAESKDRFAEALHIVEQAWSAPRFSYEGKYYRVDNVAVTPKPFQKPLPPIRVAASSPDTFPAIGKLGYPIFVMPRGTFSDMRPSIESYRAAYREAGHPGHGQVYLRVPLYVGETAERARSEPEPSIMHFFREQAARLRASANRPGTSANDGRTERAALLDTLTYADAIRGKIIVGTPERVAEQLLALQEELGLDGILAELNTGGLIPHDCVVNALRLLCQEV